jgi:hypothetical protein
MIHAPAQSLEKRIGAVELGVAAVAEASAASRRAQEQQEKAALAEVLRMKRGFLIQVRSPGHD